MSNLAPLGTQFKSYELNAAINHYTLDPYQYSITKFDYVDPSVVPGTNDSNTKRYLLNHNKTTSGLVYQDIDVQDILSAYTATKKSENSYRTMDYHRFLANDGFFNPNEGTDNTDLWYYGADKINQESIGNGGAPLNVQEVNHIIFPEPQRGGLNSSLVAKYSWENYAAPVDKTSWESQNTFAINNDENCQAFNYNTDYRVDNTLPFNKVYSFDSNYVRSIGISAPKSGSMPFAQN